MATSGTLQFSTNQSWASYRVKYSYDSSEFTIESVEVKITQYASVNRVINGLVKINNETIATVNQQIVIDVLDEWVDLDISGSADVTDTVTVSFKGSTYSKFYAAASSDTLQFYITPESQTVIVNESGSGSGSGSDDDDNGSSSGGDSGSSSTSGEGTLYISQGEGTTITVERTWSDFGDYTRSETGQVFLKTGDKVYYPADRFVITVTAKEDYQLDYYDFEGELIPCDLTNFTFSSNNTKYKLKASGNAIIATTATWTGDDLIDPDEPGSEGGEGGSTTDPPTDGNYWLIRKDNLIKFADQARRLGEVTGELSVAQMIAIFDSIVPGSEDTGGSGSGGTGDTTTYPIGEEATF